MKLHLLLLPFGSIYTDWSTKVIQFEIKTICAMTKSIRTILTPLLIMSYVFGLRIVISNHSKLWFNAIYILLIWSIYCFLVSTYHTFNFFNKYLEDNICYYLEFFTTLLSIAIGVYHNKVTNCHNICNIIDKK